VVLSICLLVGQSIVNPAKMAEPIEILFGMWTHVDPRNHLLDGGPNPPCKGALLSGKRGGLL